MATKWIKRTISTEDPCGSTSVSSKEEEKTIPFLRRLVDMLSENQDVISFVPGSIKKGQLILGRIVVHDRLKVEANVLPRYFNHSSFASLRRQLNYFSFTRMGKGRQRGATYCNEGVIEIDDILRLKRRSAVSGSSQPSTPHTAPKRERCVSISSSSSFEGEAEHKEFVISHPAKKARPSIVSPRSSPIMRSQEADSQQIALDLTLPHSEAQNYLYYVTPLPRTKYHSNGDADVLAGCRALLSFSRSTTREMIA